MNLQAISATLLLLLNPSHSYNVLKPQHAKTRQTNALSSLLKQPTHNTRREALSNLLFFTTASTFLSINPSSAAAAAAPPASSVEQDLQLIKESYESLTSLIQNWSRATISCTYADVPRELLETKNKEQLLEKASTFALFDKSTSVTSCRKTNKIVRDYLGVTGKGPLVGIEKRFLKKGVVGKVEVDDLDDYYAEVEKFSTSLSKATSFSYTAGTADFDSMNNFSKEDSNEDNEASSNLEQARLAIVECQSSLQTIVQILGMS